MTKPRTSTTKELYGLIGKVPNASKVLQDWNHFFTKKGIDASMHRYPTTVANLPERLSEMFHFDRRMYLVGESLQSAIIPMLDELDAKAKNLKKVNVVMNEGGVLKGLFSEDISPK